MRCVGSFFEREFEILKYMINGMFQTNQLTSSVTHTDPKHSWPASGRECPPPREGNRKRFHIDQGGTQLEPYSFNCLFVNGTKKMKREVQILRSHESKTRHVVPDPIEKGKHFSLLDL